MYRLLLAFTLDTAHFMTCIYIKATNTHVKSNIKSNKYSYLVSWSDKKC